LGVIASGFRVQTVGLCEKRREIRVAGEVRWWVFLSLVFIVSVSTALASLAQPVIGFLPTLWS